MRERKGVQRTTAKIRDVRRKSISTGRGGWRDQIARSAAATLSNRLRYSFVQGCGRVGVRLTIRVLLDGATT